RVNAPWQTDFSRSRARSWFLETVPAVCCIRSIQLIAKSKGQSAKSHRIAVDTASATETTREARSLHPVECLLENLDVDRISHFFPSLIDPLFLERVLSGTIGFVEDAEDTGERNLCQFVGGELVGDIVTEFVLG